MTAHSPKPSGPAPLTYLAAVPDPRAARGRLPSGRGVDDAGVSAVPARRTETSNQTETV
jgi:hypothetical protein